VFQLQLLFLTLNVARSEQLSGRK